MPKDEPTPAPVVTDALLPCPFCGSDRVGVSTGQWGDEGTRDWLECRGCGTQQAPYDGDEPDGWSKMIARWNSRAMQAAQTVVTDAMIAAGEKAWMNRDLRDPASSPLRDAYLAMQAAQPVVDSRITPEWCLKMAELEGGQEVGAGMPDRPLRCPPVDSEVMEVLREMRRHHENDHDKLAYVALLALLAKLDRKGEGS